jgi:hypothetical protein
MKKAIAICLLPVFAAMAQGPGGGRGFGGGFGGGDGLFFAGPGPQKVVTGEPYSASGTRTTQKTLTNGNQITNTEQWTVARDSQGRISTTRTVTPPASSGKAAFTVESIFDPVAGFSYRLDSATMIATQMALPPQRTSTRTPPANPNVTTTSLGTQTVNGVSATGTQVTRTIPAGTIGNAQAISVVRITWVSTALQVPVEIKTTDPMLGSSDMELTNIVQSEPKAALFVVPAGYTVKTAGAGRQGGGPGNHMRRPGSPF